MTGRRFVTLTVLVLLCSCAGVGVREAGESGSFSFVQITDTHFGARGYLESIEVTVARINELPDDISFVVHTGDIMNDNITDPEVVAEGLAALAKLRVPIYYAAGNHDISAWLPEAETTAYTRHFGNLVYHRDHQQVRFIFAFTMPLEIGLEVEGYDALQEIEAALKSAPKLPAVILLHNPPLSYRINPDDSLWRREAGALWDELIARYDVRAVLAGHLHTDELYWLEDTPLYIAPSVYNHGGRPQASSFRVYRYSAGKLSYWTYALD
jgi:Icc protein